MYSPHKAAAPPLGDHCPLPYTGAIHRHLTETYTIFSLIPPQHKQVVAPKGLDISSPTTVVMPSQIGFAQLFPQGTDSVA